MTLVGVISKQNKLIIIYCFTATLLNQIYTRVNFVPPLWAKKIRGRSLFAEFSLAICICNILS